MELLPFITLGLTFVLGIISFFIKRELDNNTINYNNLSDRIKDCEDKIAAANISSEKLNGRIDTVIAILERLEKRLEEL